MNHDEIRPVRFRALVRAAERRGEAADQLVNLAEAVSTTRCDALDRLGLLRLVELQALTVRCHIVSEARAAGYLWSEIAATLAISEDETRRRYDAEESG